MTAGRVDQANVPDVLRRLLARVAILEAVPGGGIMFDTEPQAGDWLYVETTGSHPIPGPNPFGDTAGIYFTSDAEVLWLNSTNGIFLDGEDRILGGAGGAVTVQAGTRDISAPFTQFVFFDVDVYGQQNDGVLFNVYDDDNSGWGAVVRGNNNGGISLETLGTNSSGISLFIGGTANGSPGIALGTADASGTNIGTNGDTVGFFTVGPVPQQATPVTLADVIAGLQAFGLFA